MAAKAILLHGFPDVDVPVLRDVASGATERVPGWRCPKNTARGDRLWFYIIAPESKIMAFGIALSDATLGTTWKYETTIGDVEMLQLPITLNDLRNWFPNWGWPKQPRNMVYLDSTIAATLDRQVLEHARSRSVDVTQVAAGAGFGSAAENQRIEQAAIDFVTRSLNQRGYSVKSREADKCGFDLEATMGSERLEIEVKGVKGSLEEFLITSGEYHYAMKRSPDYRLYLVLNALGGSPTLSELAPPQLVDDFDFRAIAFRASRKPDK